MGLHYNITECADFEALSEPREAALTNSIAWSSMTAKLGRVTESNVNEWVYRLDVIDELYGPLFSDAVGPIVVTETDVRRRIGMTVNVPSESRESFDQNITRVKAERDADAAYRARHAADQ